MTVPALERLPSSGGGDGVAAMEGLVDPGGVAIPSALPPPPEREGFTLMKQNNIRGTSSDCKALHAFLLWNTRPACFSYGEQRRLPLRLVSS